MKINWQLYKKKLRRLEFSHRAQLAFLEDLSSLIEDGILPTQAIDTIGKVSKDVAGIVAKDISNTIARGQGLAEGMQPWFPRAVYEVVRAGEETGTLGPTLRSATESFKKRIGAIKEILNSLLYPVMVLILALVLTVFVKDSVLQSFVQIKPLTAWPGIGKNLYHFGYLLATWWWFYLALILIALTTIVLVLRNMIGPYRYYLDKVPILSLYRHSVAARFMVTLGLLISNGIVLKKALDILHKDAPPYLAWHLLLMEYRLSGGKDNIAEVLDTHLIRETDIIRLRVIAQCKGFEHALLSLGRQASQRTAEKIGRISRIAGALLLVTTALLAMFIVAGIYNISTILSTL